MITADNQANLYVDGKQTGRNNNDWTKSDSYTFPSHTKVLAVYIKNTGGPGGLLGSLSNGIVTDSQWKCTSQKQTNWFTVDFDDSAWPAASVQQGIRGGFRVNGVAPNARWIGARDANAAEIYCRRRISFQPGGGTS